MNTEQTTVSWVRRSLWLTFLAGSLAAGAAFFVRGAALPKQPVTTSLPHPVASPVVPEGETATTPVMAAPAPALPEKRVPLQVAILLDTSSSMDGLINQARSQLWKIVNELGQARRVDGGVVYLVDLEIAVYEYGHSPLGAKADFIRQVVPFSRDLDKVSEALYSLRTNGGSEYAGVALSKAVDELAWSTDQNVLKFAYIAGNESLFQGRIPIHDAIVAAKAKHIDVQLIHCGRGDVTWTQGAAADGVALLNIDQSRVAEYVATPQDAEIARLSGELNRTYVGYGALGRASAQRQVEQDANALADNKAASLERAMTKAKAAKKADAGDWDLVSAAKADPAIIGKIADGDLPAELVGKSLAEKQTWVATKQAERDAIAAKIEKLSAARNQYVAEAQAKRAAAAPPAAPRADSFDSAAVKSAKSSGAAKGYKF